MIVRFIPEAEVELDAAIAHYDGLAPGLGSKFAIEIRDGLVRIETLPKAWQSLSPRARRYRLQSFPHGIVYAELPAGILVLAIMHLHRKPEYWKGRAEGT